MSEALNTNELYDTHTKLQ